MSSIAIVQRFVWLISLTVLQFAWAAMAQMTTFPNEFARVGAFEVDSDRGELLSVSPALQVTGTPPLDFSVTVGEFTIDALQGDVIEAPAAFPDSFGAGDRSADVENTVVDAEAGELISAPPNAPDSGGAVDRSVDVAGTTVDATDGVLLAAPATSTQPLTASDHHGMVGITRVDAPNGALVAGPTYRLLPEPSLLWLAAAGALAMGILRGRR